MKDINLRNSLIWKIFDFLKHKFKIENFIFVLIFEDVHYDTRNMPHTSISMK